MYLFQDVLRQIMLSLAHPVSEDGLDEQEELGQPQPFDDGDEQIALPLGLFAPQRAPKPYRHVSLGA